MKYLGILFFILMTHQTMAQQRLGQTYLDHIRQATEEINIGYEMMPDNDFINIPKDISLIAVSTTSGAFHRTYTVNDAGQTISSGFMPSAYFMPNNNLIVITGDQRIKRDSFNPYGADDLASMLLFATFNNFIGKLKINRR
jgi:hypothetical protein